MSKTAITPTIEAAPAPLRYFAPATRRRVYTDVGTEPSLTRQEYKDDCDINRILAQYQRTGALNHFAKYAGSYGDFDACDFQTAHNIMIRAREMFDALPANVKKLVATPQGFLEFVQDPANADKMAELGLRQPRNDHEESKVRPATPPNPAATGGSGGA